MKYLGILVVGGLLVGCGSEVTVFTEEECVEAFSPAAAALDRASRAYEAYVQGEIDTVATACNAIASDLGGTPAPLSSPVNPKDAHVACEAADAVLTDSISVNINTMGSCEVDTVAVASCVAECGTADGCQEACDAEGLFTAACTLPSVTVEGPDAVKTTLEANLPAIVGVQSSGVSNISDGVGALAMAAQHVLDEASDVECSPQVSLLTNVAERVSEATTRYTDLLEAPLFPAGTGS